MIDGTEKPKIPQKFARRAARYNEFGSNDHGLFSLCELRLCVPLDVQRKCSEWIKLATTNFSDSLGQTSVTSP